MNLYFVAQVIKLFQTGNYTEDELRMAYDYLLSIDNDVIFTYINDTEEIELYVFAMNLVIKAYEKKEEYEKCYLLKKKTDLTKQIIKKELKV